ncbi:SDR family oxidoreductase [Rhodococcus sp. ACPA1]|uniref:SDR family oxidoreductase n=1 Tax=Rhodococcus sp. ACPA1 TaxID=2028572 RepID=UPI000BB12FC2|nr:SDR family oxidoreductase [Rhodococcus sp. ACPA1]PBC51307.1 hypothetical protein CJ177_36200 [Rhodococcus sp. ACPA1]
MNNNEEAYKLFCPDIENPKREQMIERMKTMHPLDVAGVDCQDVSNAYRHLLSDDARMVTGEVLHVSAGLSPTTLREPWGVQTARNRTGNTERLRGNNIYSTTTDHEKTDLRVDRTGR